MAKQFTRKADSISNYDEEHVYQLLKGYSRFNDVGFGDSSDPRALKRMRTAWQALRDELLADWIAEHPGTRPAAWWLFDSPEPRRRLNGQHPFDNLDRQARIDELAAKYPGENMTIHHELFFGCPCTRLIPDDYEAVYESEQMFLERLGLLVESEQAALQAG